MKGKVIAELSVVPVGTGDAGLSRYVAACLDVLTRRKDVSYQLTPMGTVLEGSLDIILDVVRKMHEAPFGMGVQRVVTTIKIDERRDKLANMVGKVESVRKLRPAVKI
ncbi:MAG: MTH1187 family thiamine-binding protein [Chloroflexi bacterium]|nr:MTH1187 family thiamine-binding protein [Chloroflexota bacterium]MBM4453248.1 MTH1187 family thiamine-binding protein [Chloroflexota bacterium]